MRPTAFAAALLLTFALLAAMPQPAFASPALCTDYVQCSRAGMFAHGYAAAETTSHWGMYGGHNCTNYVAYMLGVAGVAEPSYSLGNAAEWGPAAAAAGVGVDHRAVGGSVAWWSSGAGGLSWAGHVAWVEVVSPAGVTVSEDNYPYGPFDWRFIPAGGSGWPTAFIHFVPLDGPQDPSIATAPGGATAVATVRTDRSVVLHSRSAAGARWTTQLVAPAGSAYSGPSLALGAGGLAEIAVEGPRASLVIYDRLRAGSAWAMEEVGGPGSVSSAPTALLDSGGGLEVAVGGSRHSLDLYAGAAYAAYAAVPAGGAGRSAGIGPAAAPPEARLWTTALLAGPDSVWSRPAVTAGPGGRLEVAVVGAQRSLVLHTGVGAGLWTVQTVTGPGTAFAAPSVLAPADGSLQIATVGPGRTARVDVSDDGGTTWRTEALSAPGNAVGAPTLVPAAAGKVSAALIGPGGTVTLTTTGTAAAAVGAAVAVAPAVAAPGLTSGPVAPSDARPQIVGTVELARITADGALQVVTIRPGSPTRAASAGLGS